jgi:hypothetical protein
VVVIDAAAAGTAERVTTVGNAVVLVDGTPA